MPSEQRLRGLYAVTPESGDTEALLAASVSCLEGGAMMLQYRAKALDPARSLVQARRLAAACRAHGVPFIVNDSIALALAALADGVHVGRADASVREARIAFPRGIVGASCYADPQRAREARRDGADYVGVGSMFASTTKPAAPTAPLAAIDEARAASGLPVAAIGGITIHNAPVAIAAGADMVAVISALFDAEDVRACARAFTRLFDANAPGDADVRAQPRTV